MEKSTGTKEQKSGKRLPGSYWIERTKTMQKGEITSKELVKESSDYLKSIGYIWNPVLGWVKPDELEGAKLETNQNAVPVRIDITTKGKKKRINYKFLQYVEDKKQEEKTRWLQREGVDSLVQAVAESFGQIEKSEVLELGEKLKGAPF